MIFNATATVLYITAFITCSAAVQPTSWRQWDYNRRAAASVSTSTPARAEVLKSPRSHVTVLLFQFFACLVMLAYGVSTFLSFRAWKGLGSNAATSQVTNHAWRAACTRAGWLSAARHRATRATRASSGQWWQQPVLLAHTPGSCGSCSVVSGDASSWCVHSADPPRLVPSPAASPGGRGLTGSWSSCVSLGLVPALTHPRGTWSSLEQRWWGDSFGRLQYQNSLKQARVPVSGHLQPQCK